MHPVYMAVTKDEYELPYAVADSAYELARMIGANVQCILHATSSLRRPSRKSKYKPVCVSDDE